MSYVISAIKHSNIIYMKAKRVFYSIIIAAFIFTFSSCSKNNSSSSSGTDNTAEAEAQANDQLAFTNATDEVNDDVNAVINIKGGSYNSRTEGNPLFTLPCDLTNSNIVVDTTVNPCTITITYNGSTCNLTHTRTGTVVISFPSNFRWGAEGNVLSISFNNLKVTNSLTGKSITLNGTRTITNVTGGLLSNLATLPASDSIVNTVSDANMSITFDNSAQRTWQTTIRRVFTYNSESGVVVTTTGSSQGINRYGHNFTTTITQPLVYAQTCLAGYIGGQIKTVGSAVTTIVTVGLTSALTPVSSCQAVMYYQITWIGANGKTFSFSGEY